MSVEKRDIPLSAILKWTASLACIVAVVPLTLWFFYHRELVDLRTKESRAMNVRAFPEPRLTGEPRDQLLLYKAQQKTQLETYSNHGEIAGTVQVPVTRAIEEMAK